jgi:hypothetical protein
MTASTDDINQDPEDLDPDALRQKQDELFDQAMWKRANLDGILDKDENEDIFGLRWGGGKT